MSTLQPTEQTLDMDEKVRGEWSIPGQPQGYDIGYLTLMTLSPINRDDDTKAKLLGASSFYACRERQIGTYPPCVACFIDYSGGVVLQQLLHIMR